MSSHNIISVSNLVHYMGPTYAKPLAILAQRKTHILYDWLDIANIVRYNVRQLTIQYSGLVLWNDSLSELDICTCTNTIMYFSK